MSLEKRNAILILGIVISIAILGGFLFLYVQSQKQGTADLSVTSVTISPTAEPFGTSSTTNNYATNVYFAYNLNINLQIKFNGQMHFNYYTALSVCSFSLQLNSSVWQVVPITCTLPPQATESFSGSHNFNLNFILLPKNSSNGSFSNMSDSGSASNYQEYDAYNNITIPFSISFSVYSPSYLFNVSTPNKILQVNSTSYQKIFLTNASLTKETLQNGSIYYNINASFTYVTDYTISVAHGCLSPFNLLLTSPSGWNLTHIDCQSILNHTITPGRFRYSLSSNLVNPNGQEYNFTTPLPSNINLKISLGNNLTISNNYIIYIV